MLAMDATADELAGVVSLFGGLTRAELERALSEVAFRADGQSVDEAAVDAALEDALENFALVRYEPAVDEGGIGDVDEPLLVPGPTAFPRTPDAAEDVPHILDIEPRSIDRERLGAQTRERFDRAVEAAIDAADPDRAAQLVDASYDLEAWAPIDLAGARERLAVVEADSADVIVERDANGAIGNGDSSTDERTPEDDRDEPPADPTTE